MTSIGEETTKGWEHVLGLLRRWWLVLTMGTVFGLTIAAVLVVGDPLTYRADSVVLIEQPAVALQPTVGKESLEHIVELLPTVGQLVVRDGVLRAVVEELGLDRDPLELRRDIKVVPIPETVTLRVSVEMDDREAAADVNAALVAHLSVELTGLGVEGNSAPLTMEVLQQDDVRSVGQNRGRTLLLAGLLGFGFALLAAAVLDRG